MSKFGPLLISLSGLIVTKDESQILASEYVGGVIFFRENIENASQLIKLIDTIKSINDKLLLFIDQEGGKVKRITFPPFDTFKSQYEYGRTNLKEYIQELCTTNLKLQEYGIHVNLAPTLDSFSPNCPVIGKLGRSFTNNLDELSHIARTIYKEQRKISMPTVAKHFPDHGNTVDDSH
ncbi:MAG: hypothetical protein HOI53_01740, partial [Francisellaceae bacterium]|nr:hypothetical protein [Francisellaceae bacterium]